MEGGVIRAYLEFDIIAMETQLNSSSSMLLIKAG
jgi:hypothetical protein